MVNSEHKLTVDDLIIEYMMYNVKNGYEPSFLISEFINFLSFFESKMEVEDTLYENRKLFERFFERKNERDWSVTDSYVTMKKHAEPHMDMQYLEKDNDYIIKANYRLSEYDGSLINTYFMSGGKWGKGKTEEIRNIIGEYLSKKPKRKIDESIKINDNELNVGKYVAVEIINNIWASYIKKKVEYHEWPRQCKDIYKYLIEMDLSEIIGVESIKNKLLKFYKVVSKRVGILYNQDKNLEISSNTNGYLAKANYDLIFQGFEDIMRIAFAFGKFKKSLSINLSELKFIERYEVDECYYLDEDFDVKTTTTDVGNENTKRLVKSLDRAILKK